MNRFVRTVVAVIALGTAWASPIRAEIIYGIAGPAPVPPNEAATTLVRFDSANPGGATTVGTLTGIATGQSLSGIHFRPSNGQLYAISNNNNAATLYTVNLNTAALTTVGTFNFPGQFIGSHVSMAFNPVTGGLRVVGWNDAAGSPTDGVTQNLRIDPDTGALVGTDSTPAYGAGDPNSAVVPAQLAAIGYSNNFPGATSTTLYAWDYALDVFARVGSLNGTPNSPNTGIMETVATYGSPSFLTYDPTVGLDISGATGTAYVSFNTDVSNGTDYVLQSVNLTTGVRTPIGSFPGGMGVYDISVQPIPEPSSLALLGIAGIGYAIRFRRRRAAQACS